MFQANSKALFQQANEALLNIRQQEIQYYVSVFQSFATQAAFVAGFTYAVLQTNKIDHVWVFHFHTFFFAFCCCTILLAIHVILISLFLQVYGTGLSLHGPTGSMVHAANIMRRETSTVIRSFIAMLGFFAASTCCVYWLNMDTLSATICTVATIIAVRQWYYYSRRIYLSLYWKTEYASTRSPVTEYEVDDPVFMRTHIANITSHVAIEGYLWCKEIIEGSKPGTWGRYYFVLKYTLSELQAFKDRAEVKPLQKTAAVQSENELFEFGSDKCEILFDLNSIPVEERRATVAEWTGNQFFIVLVATQDGKCVRYILRCDTQEEWTRWKEALVSAASSQSVRFYRQLLKFKFQHCI